MRSVSLTTVTVAILASMVLAAPIGNSEATRRNGPIEEDGTFAGLWRREDPAPVEEDRTFGGLWRREDSAPVEEDRTFAGLWRRYVSKKA